MNPELPIKRDPTGQYPPFNVQHPPKNHLPLPYQPPTNNPNETTHTNNQYTTIGNHSLQQSLQQLKTWHQHNNKHFNETQFLKKHTPLGTWKTAPTKKAIPTITWTPKKP